MSEIKNGGPAFPLAHSHVDLQHTNWSHANGLTVRDYFAAKALQGVAMRFDLMGHAERSANTPDMVAHFCYQLADSMLRARGEA